MEIYIKKKTQIDNIQTNDFDFNVLIVYSFKNCKTIEIIH